MVYHAAALNLSEVFGPIVAIAVTHIPVNLQGRLLQNLSLAFPKPTADVHVKKRILLALYDDRKELAGVGFLRFRKLQSIPELVGSIMEHACPWVHDLVGRDIATAAMSDSNYALSLALLITCGVSQSTRNLEGEAYRPTFLQNLHPTEWLRVRMEIISTDPGHAAPRTKPSGPS
ncbi:hypothetical protein HDV00_010380 [Rhizophlyctis rosea]|nr:hypothetical protein HDV00_010380 [Rhizophlyctis rosea]